MYGQASATLGVAGNSGAASFVTTGTVPSEGKFASVMHLTLLTNEPPAVATSNQMAQSTSPAKCGFNGVQRSSSRK